MRSSILPAEWDCEVAIMLAWPHADTDWAYMLDEAQKCYVRLIEAISQYHKVILVSPDSEVPKQMLSDIPSDRLFHFTTPTNDTWTRDFGPITVRDKDGKYHPLDFCFNGWGMKFAACRDNLVTSAMSAKSLINAAAVNCRGFVLEGGGIESDGNGVIMSTASCQYSPNRNAGLTRDEIDSYLLERFGASRLIMLNNGYLAGDDTDSHIDTLARFCPNDTIVYVGCDDPSDEHYESLQAMKNELFAKAVNVSGQPYNLIELPLPDPIYDEDGQRLPATYANFLATSKAVFMPIYGQPKKDHLAQQILQIVFDNIPVVTVDCNALIQQHGSLHCATMQIPLEILSI